MNDLATNARFDHLVIAVPDLDEAVARWGAAGLAATVGGRHPGGTVNALVRGPGAAYVELITTGPDASGAWADRVRDQHGVLSWAVAVEDVDDARSRLLEAGFSPAEVVDGSRETPTGETIRWRLLQVGARAFDPGLPFLIEWVEPMPTGPADGPVLESVRMASHDPAPLVLMLETVGLPRDRSFEDAPWWIFRDPDGVQVSVVTAEGDEGAEVANARRDVVVDHLSLTVAHTPQQPPGESTVLDGVHVHLHPDLRAHRAHEVLLATDRIFAARPAPTPGWPAPHPHRAPLEEEYSRCLDPGKYRILAERADAWIEALTTMGLADAEELDTTSVEQGPTPWSRVTRLVPRATGAVPLTIGRRGFDGPDDNSVMVAVDDDLVSGPGLPDCGCDACDDGSTDLLHALDEDVLVVLGGGILRVDHRGRTLRRTLEGWQGSGSFGPDEAERWLAGDTPRGASVVSGQPWL
ncbi:DUF6226 family protein [Ornithinimicrobium panacihumi]|uniref:DUF6226 family protein n=1 Tax=Ornithinimicrobium panacihumi TaxID=2008449 RepID=UPI003F89FF00